MCILVKGDNDSDVMSLSLTQDRAVGVNMPHVECVHESWGLTRVVPLSMHRSDNTLSSGGLGDEAWLRQGQREAHGCSRALIS